VFVYILSKGQSLPTDTIDYSVFITDKPTLYILKRIEEKWSGKEFTFKSKILSLTKAKESAAIPPLKALIISSGDTITNTDWDMNADRELFKYHSMGKVKLKQSANLLTVTKVNWSGIDIAEPVERKFKILKWTASEIILKDVSNFKLKRIYYFTAN